MSCSTPTPSHALVFRFPEGKGPNPVLLLGAEEELRHTMANLSQNWREWLAIVPCLGSEPLTDETLRAIRSKLEARVHVTLRAWLGSQIMVERSDQRDERPLPTDCKSDEAWRKATDEWIDRQERIPCDRVTPDGKTFLEEPPYYLDLFLQRTKTDIEGMKVVDLDHADGCDTINIVLEPAGELVPA